MTSYDFEVDYVQEENQGAQMLAYVMAAGLGMIVGGIVATLCFVAGA